MIIAYLISNSQFNIWNISYITSHMGWARTIRKLLPLIHRTAATQNHRHRSRSQIINRPGPTRSVRNSVPSQQLRRSPKEREAFNIWILICEITRGMHSVTPCTHEINEYKGNRFNTFGNKFCKIFGHYKFLIQLGFAPHFKLYNVTTTTEKPTWNDPWTITKSFCFRPRTRVLTRKPNAPSGGPHFGSNSPLHRA